MPVERRDPGCSMLEMEGSTEAIVMRKRGPRTPEEKVRELQDKLHLSAKRAAAAKARAGVPAIPHRSALRPRGGFIACRKPSRDTPAHACDEKELRKPYAGKPHVRFDEGALETESRKGLRHRLCGESRR